MRRLFVLLVTIVALALAALACNFGSTPPTDAPIDPATSVAATLTSLAPATGTSVSVTTVTAAAAAAEPPAGRATTETAPSPSDTPSVGALATCNMAYVDNGN